MRMMGTLLLVALAAAAAAHDAVGRRGDSVATPLQPGPRIEPGEFAYARTLPRGPAELVAVRLDAAVLAHSTFTTAGRFADLRIVDGQSRQVPYLVERLDEPLRVPLSLVSQVTTAPNGRSVYVVVLPHAGLPASTLVLRTSANVFRREVLVDAMRRVDGAGREQAFNVVPRTAWRHDQASGTAAPPLSLDLPAPGSERLQLTVSEGDNVPLPISGVELQLPAYQVRFQRPADTPLSMLYGRPDLPAPEYDLALIRRQVLDAPVTAITAGPERSQVPASARPVLPRTAFWFILAFATVALVWMIRTLVRMVGKDRE